MKYTNQVKRVFTRRCCMEKKRDPRFAI